MLRGETSSKVVVF